MESEAQWLQEVVESEDAGEQKAGWSNGAGPLAALLRLLKLQEKGRQRPPPSHLRASGLAIPHALHYCTALLTMGLLRPAPLAIIDARGVHPGVHVHCSSCCFGAVRVCSVWLGSSEFIRSAVSLL